jgi:hypothetical protein
MTAAARLARLACLLVVSLAALPVLATPAAVTVTLVRWPYT